MLICVSPECGVATDSLVQDVLGFRAQSCDRIGENIPRVSARIEEGTTVPDATRAEMSYGPRSTDTSDCSRFRAHTHERIGENATCTSAAFDGGATVQAAHRVAAPFEEGTTVPAGTQAETCFGRRSADKSVPPVLRSPAHVRECKGEAAPCVTTPVPTLGSPVPRISDHTRICTGESASLGFTSVQVRADLDGMNYGCVDTFLPDSSSRAHQVIGAPVSSGESSGQRSVDVSDSPALYLVAPVPIGANSGQKIVDVSDSHTQSITAPTGASSRQRSVDVSDSQYRGEVGSIFIAPSSADVNPGQRITRAHTDDRSGHRASSAQRERNGETASANDPGQRLNPPASQTAHLAARRGGRPTLMSSRSSGSTPGQSYRDSVRAHAGHARSTAESIARLMAPTRQRPHPRS